MHFKIYFLNVTKYECISAWCLAKASLVHLPLQPGPLSLSWGWGTHRPVSCFLRTHHFSAQVFEDPICGSFSQEPPGSFQTSLQCRLMQRIHFFQSLPPSAFLISLSFLPRPICPSFPPFPSPLRSPLFALPTRGAWLSSLPPSPSLSPSACLYLELPEAAGHSPQERRDWHRLLLRGEEEGRREEGARGRATDRHRPGPDRRTPKQVIRSSRAGRGRRAGAGGAPRPRSEVALNGWGAEGPGRAAREE